jgi:uncharacterized caspase-like protein
LIEYGVVKAQSQIRRRSASGGAVPRRCQTTKRAHETGRYSRSSQVYDITTRGEALLTSSTSDELARESDALRGSFFTHHLVSGLRGAADQSKDGRVTLAEAYDYAYAKTVTQAEGGQHPTFKYDLAGRGDVVLTALADAGAWLDSCR